MCYTTVCYEIWTKKPPYRKEFQTLTLKTKKNKYLHETGSGTVKKNSYHYVLHFNLFILNPYSFSCNWNWKWNNICTLWVLLEPSDFGVSHHWFLACHANQWALACQTIELLNDHRTFDFFFLIMPIKFWLIDVLDWWNIMLLDRFANVRRTYPTKDDQKNWPWIAQKILLS